MNKTEHRSI